MFGDKVPEQETVSNEKFLVDAIAAAHRAYGKAEAIVVVVAGIEKNVLD